MTPFLFLLAVCFVSVGYVLGRLHAAAVHHEGPWDDSLSRMGTALATCGFCGKPFAPLRYCPECTVGTRRLLDSLEERP